MLIRDITKSASPLMMKKKYRSLRRLGFFCYTKMMFELKNGGATYQKYVHTVLEGQIGRNVEAYIDDIVVKSKKHGDLLDDLKETFDNLRKFKMMLNSKKCIFGMSSDKLLGYMVSSRGIDVNPKKVEAIKKLQPPQTRKKFKSWQPWWLSSANLYPSWENVVYHSIGCYAKRTISSGMIRRQRRLLSWSNISSPCQP
jgi:hypothetical protein